MSEPERLNVRLIGGHEVEGGKPGGPTIRVDGDGKNAPSSVHTLLIALASCTSYDVVEILAKRRTPVESLDIEVVAQRVDTIPRRLSHVLMKYKIGGKGIEQGHAERAVDLAVNKYCSVRESLRPDVPVEWTVELIN